MIKKDHEFMIDRRVITDHLIKYVNPNSSQTLKIEMLDILSSMLAFTIDDKEKLGLVKRQTIVTGEEAKSDNPTIVSGKK
jgi:hypothetical protein